MPYDFERGDRMVRAHRREADDCALAGAILRNKLQVVLECQPIASAPDAIRRLLAEYDAATAEAHALYLETVDGPAPAAQAAE